MDELELLLEERAIMRTLHAYAQAMDAGEEERWVRTFTDDAVFDVYRPGTGERVHREDGRDSLAAYIRGYPKPPSYRKHLVVDPMIEIDGDEARVEAYWVLLQRNDLTGAAELAAFGRYHDRLAKIDGTWRIRERLAEVEAM